jgi:hypothetical protein
MAFNVFVMFILINMFITMICDAFEEAKEEEKDGDPLGLEAYLYEQIAKFFTFGDKKSGQEGNGKNKLNSEELKTMASLGQQNMYMEHTEQFDFKTTQLVTVLKMVRIACFLYI